MENIAWMAWTLPTAIFFVLLASTLARHDLACGCLSRSRARRHLAHSDHARRPPVHFAGADRRDPSGVDRLVGTDSIFTLPIGEGVEISSLWLATVISLVTAVAVFRTV